jgi:hypothetical protein
MRTLIIIVSLASNLSFAVTTQSGTEAFSGEIMDAQCALLGSHKMMLKTTGADNDKDCALACAKMGGRYMLYDPASKKAYQLDDQSNLAAFAGQKVTVTGNLDASTKLIHVGKIAPAS